MPFHALPRQFGSLPHGQQLERVRASPHYVKGAFRNLAPTPLFTQPGARWSAIRDFLTASGTQTRPPQPLPAVRTGLRALDRQSDLLVWLGHSSYFLQLGGKRLLIDPVLGAHAAPLPFLNPAFAGSDVYRPADLPDIDHVLISHDHWDHLDYATITALKDRTGAFITPLGVGAHLERWGIAPGKIHELDWWEWVSLAPDFIVHALPARHFSGRALHGNQSLWCGFLIGTPKARVLYSGDSGYGPHFAEMGARFGGVDLAILETGQYDDRWRNVHMAPEETARAAADVRAMAVVPAHFGKFAMARHSWDDPVIRLAAASAGRAYALLTPMLGEVLAIGQAGVKTARWWETVAGGSQVDA